MQQKASTMKKYIILLLTCFLFAPFFPVFAQRAVMQSSTAVFGQNQDVVRQLTAEEYRRRRINDPLYPQAEYPGFATLDDYPFVPRRSEPIATLIVPEPRTSSTVSGNSGAYQELVNEKADVEASKAAAALFDTGNFGFKVAFDKDINDYQAGEPIIFRFDLTCKTSNPPDIPLYVEWKRTGDDGLSGAGRNIITIDKPLGLSTSMDKPGFIHFEATLKDEAGKTLATFNGGAGVDLANIKAAAKEPEDFDRYWEKVLGELNDVALFPEVKKVSVQNAPVDVYAVVIPCTGPRPATGYLSIPAKAKPGSLPMELHLQAYGMRIPEIPKTPPEDKILFDLNAHGLDLGESRDYYNRFSQKIGHYGYDLKENSNRDTAYFKYMVVRLVRTCEYMKTIPQWDGKNFRVWGYSQGGLQTLWAAGLVKGISEADAGMPWSCNLGGAPIDQRLKGGCPEYTEAMNYYDPVFFAKRIPETCLMYFNRTGLGDYTSPPSSVVSVYNNVPGPKKITFYQGIGHEEPKADSKAYTLEGSLDSQADKTPKTTKASGTGKTASPPAP